MLKRTILGIVLVLTFGCGPNQSDRLENNKAVVRQLVEAINARSYDLLDDVVAEDFVRHCQATPDVQVRSLDDMKQYLQNDLEVFPDSRIDIEILLAEGDMVAGYLTYTGTQKGAMGSFPASNKKVDLACLGIIRLENGKIAEMWIEWDNLAILSQLGYWPPKAT